MIDCGIVSLHFIPSHLNVADMLTKALPDTSFSRHRDILLNGHGGINPIDVRLEYANYSFLDKSNMYYE